MTQHTRIAVVIDSNAVWNDWLLTRDVWARLRILSERGLVEVYVPEVVVQELARGYKRALNDLVAGMDKLGLDKLTTLLGLTVPSNVADLNVSTAERIAAYKPALRARLAELGAITLPVPDVDQQTMLTRALAARKPFDADGKKGYRDALIWHTVLGLCRDRGTSTKIVFVTDNVKDFCGTTGKLHDTLVEEVAETGALPIETVRGLGPAVQHLTEVEHLDAELEQLDAGLNQRRPVPVALSREQVEDIVTTACEQLTSQRARTTAPLEYDFSDFSDFSGFDTIIEDEADLDEIVPDLETLTWHPAGRDLDGRPMVEMTIDATVTLDGMASKADYYGATGDVEVRDADWNDHYMWVATVHRGKLSLLVYLNTDGTDFDAVELVDAEEVVAEAGVY